MGRKKLPETERRTHWLKIRLNQKEYEMLQKLSEWYEEPKSHCIRGLIYEEYEKLEDCLTQPEIVKTDEPEVFDPENDKWGDLGKRSKEYLDNVARLVNSMDFRSNEERVNYIRKLLGYPELKTVVIDDNSWLYFEQFPNFDDININGIIIDSIDKEIKKWLILVILI